MWLPRIEWWWVGLGQNYGIFHIKGDVAHLLHNTLHPFCNSIAWLSLMLQGTVDEVVCDGEVRKRLLLLSPIQIFSTQCYAYLFWKRSHGIQLSLTLGTSDCSLKCIEVVCFLWKLPNRKRQAMLHDLFQMLALMEKSWGEQSELAPPSLEQTPDKNLESPVSSVTRLP